MSSLPKHTARYAELLGRTPDDPSVQAIFFVYAELIDEEPGGEMGVSYLPGDVQLLWERENSASPGWTLSGIHLLAGESGLGGFDGPLPAGLRFGATEAEVRALLGEPSEVLPPEDDTDEFTVLGYPFDTAELRVTLREKRGVYLVGVYPPAAG